MLQHAEEGVGAIVGIFLGGVMWLMAIVVWWVMR
jgi:hypothetical protein